MSLLQFNSIAADYQRFVGADPFRQYLHYPAVISALAKTAHRSVLDIGCGDGALAEIAAKELGCRVTGIDLAPEQVRLAQAREESNPCGCNYLLAAAENFNAGVQFDAAVSVLVLPYAEDLDQLRAFFDCAFRHLAADAVFLSVVFNPEFLAFGQNIGSRRFNPAAEKQVRVSFLNPDQSTAFTSQLRQFSTIEYESAAQSAGFLHSTFSLLQPSAAGAELYGAEYWDICRREQPYCLMTASRFSEGLSK